MKKWLLVGLLWFAGANIADTIVWWGYLCREYLFPYASTTNI